MSWAQADRYVSRTGTRWSAGFGGRMGPGAGATRLRPGRREELTVPLVLNVSCSSSPRLRPLQQTYSFSSVKCLKGTWGAFS